MNRTTTEWSASYRVGIDVGGTFTDLYLLNEKGGSVVRHKLPLTPDNPYEAPIKGIEASMALYPD